MKTKDFLTDPKFIKWVNNPEMDLDAYWKDWVANNPEHLSQFKLARELLLRIQYQEFEPRAGAKQRILENILNSQPAPAQTIKTTNKTHTTIWRKAGQLSRIAAILLIAVSLSWLVAPPQGTSTEPNLALEIALMRKQTASGEKMQVTLPDGTQVWLNSNSELEFPERFDVQERLVSLSGEAFFEVEKDALRPFKVLANKTVTTAVGTSFNINTKVNDRVEVSLLTGKAKVKATSASEEIFLDPGQQLIYEIPRGEISIHGFDAKQVLGWKEDRILFNDNSLDEVVEKLEEWYGVKIQLINAEGIDWKYSGDYKNQTLDDVLNSLAYIQKFNYTIREKNVEFKF